MPADRTHVYHMYRVRWDPMVLGIEDNKLTETRDKIISALVAEGVPCSTWQTSPVPAQTLFKLKEGYGRNCPWSCKFYGKDIQYREEDYSETIRLLSTSLVLVHEKTRLNALYPPNGLAVAELIVEAFYKIFENLPEVLKDQT